MRDWKLQTWLDELPPCSLRDLCRECPDNGYTADERAKCRQQKVETKK